MTTDMQAYQVRQSDPAITVLKWIAGIISGVAVVLIAAGIIGEIATLRAFDRMSGNVDSNTQNITRLVDLKANKETVSTAHEGFQKDIIANSARIVILNDRIDKLYRKAVYHPPLKEPEVLFTSYTRTPETSCTVKYYASINSRFGS